MLSAEAADAGMAWEGNSCVRARKDVPRSGSALCMSMGQGSVLSMDLRISALLGQAQLRIK